MNLFRMASRGVDLGALPEDDAPRALIDFGPSAGPVVRGSVPAEMNDLFEAAASEYGVDPTILKGIAYAESRFRPDIISGQVTSPAGAVGLMQFMPATAKEMGINPLDPVESVFGAAAYLRQSLDKFGGDTERAIASYNWGRNRSAFDREDWFKSLPAETRNYVGTVLEFADGLQAPAAVSAPQHGIQIPLADGVQPSAAGAGRGTFDDPRRLDNPENQPQKPFLSQVADSAAGLVKTAAASNPVLGRFLKIAGGPQDKPSGSVLIDQPVAVGGANPNDTAENERLSRRDYAEQVEQRQRLANSQQMREPVAPTGAQAYAEANPIKAALKGDAARTLAGALNAPSVLAGLGAESVNRAATDAGGAPVFDRVPNMPLVDDLRKVTQDYASQLARRSPGQAWDNGEFGRWMLTQMAGNSISASMSLAALFLPGAQATILGSMGATAAGSAYGDGDTAGAAALKGLVEVGSEKLPLHAAEKVKDLVLAIPASARNQVLTEAGKRLLAAGTAISANSLVGAIEESAAEIGGNAIDKYVSGKNKSLFEDVDRAALVGAAFGGGMSAPAVAATMGTPQGIAARELAGALQADLPATGGTVADMLRTEQNSTAQIAPEATSLAAADAEVARLQSVPQVQDQPTTPQAPVVVQPQQVAEVPVQPPVAPAAPEQSQAEQAVENIGALMDAAPKSELTAQPADVARQVLASEAGATAASVPTVEQAEQQLAAREAPVEMQMRPTGTLLVKGDVPALRERLAAAGVDNTIAVQGGLVVSRSQAAQAQQALSTTAPAQQPPAATQQEAANVPQAQAQATQPAAQAAQTAAPDIAPTVAPVPATGVSAAGDTATAQADGVTAGANESAPVTGSFQPRLTGLPGAQGRQEILSSPNEQMPSAASATPVGSNGRLDPASPELRFSRAPGYNAAVDAAITAGMKGEAPGRQPVAIGDTTAAMQAAGIPAGELRTSPVILTKALFDHGVTKPVLKQIPDLLENPVMVFSSASVDGSYVVVTSEMVRGQPLIVAVSPEETRGGVAFNFVPSLYPKDDLGALQRWMNSGLLRYIDQKQSPSWFGSTRLQLPGEYRSAKGLQDSNVATDAALVKNEGGGVDEGKTYSKEMSPELARMLMAMGRPIGMATKGTVRGAANELVNGVGLLPNGLGRVVVATSDEIKTEWEPLIGPTGMEASGDLGQAQGFYDPKTKTVFVIADHIRQGDELGVVAHELMHKHGQAVLGAEGWDRLHSVIGTWANADQATMERRVHDEARARVEASRPEGADADSYSTQELFPYAVQVALEAGVKPSLAAPQGTVARWLGQVRAALRQVWSKVTGKPGQFEAQDLVNLAFGIAQRENPAHSGELDGAVQNDGAPQTDSTDDGEMQFSREQTTPEKPALQWRDETGRLQFAPGHWLFERLGDAARPLLSALGLKAASPELRRQLRVMKLQVQRAQELSAKVATEAAKLSAADRAMVSDLVEKDLQAGTIPPEHAVKLAAIISTTMERQSKELVELGMLSKEAAERWEGTYLPRFYESKMTKKVGDAWADAMRRLVGKPRLMKGIGGKHLKGRGIFETINPASLENYQALGWEVRDLDYVPGTSTEVQVWRDFNREERASMGEIRDAGFRFVMGYMQTQRDIALGRMFENLANDERFSSRLPTKEMAVRVPDSKVEGTGATVYGKLAGRYVSKETLSHLSSFDEVHNDALQMYRQAMSLWKEGKTVLNPVAHMNNVVSNLTMAHLAGISYHRGDKYISALGDFIKGSPMIEDAKNAGLFLGNFSQSELMESMPDELKKLVNLQEGLGAKSTKTAMAVLTWALRKPLGKAYEFEDSFFKYLLYKDARQRGLEQQDAIDFAQRYIFTYDDLPKGARRIRDFGIPFFAYTYKAVPALLHTAMAHPVRMATPAALLWATTALTYAAMADGDDDTPWDELVKKYLTDAEFRKKAGEAREFDQKHMPTWMRGSTAFFTPKTMRVGYDKVMDLPVFLDISRFIPGGDLFDVTPNAGGLPLPQPVTPNHPLLTMAMGLLGNKDLFSGKELVDKNDTKGEAAEKRLLWIYRQVAPAVAIGQYHWNRGMDMVAQASGGEITWMPEVVAEKYTGVGNDGLPVLPKYGIPQTFGIKIRPLDQDKAEAIERAIDRKLIQSIDADIRQLARQNRNGTLSDRAYEKQRDFQREKRDRLKDGLTVDGAEKE